MPGVATVESAAAPTGPWTPVRNRFATNAADSIRLPLGPESSLFYYQIAGSLAGGPYYSYRTWDCAFLLADASPPPSPPALTIMPGSNHTVVLSWPAAATGYRPQVCSDLRTPTWSDATTPVSLVGTNRQAVMSAPASQAFSGSSIRNARSLDGPLESGAGSS